MDSESPSSKLKQQLRKFTAALARSSRNPRVLEEMADVLVRLERRHEGLSCYLNSGQCYLEQKKFRDAGRAFKKVLDLDPAHAGTGLVITPTFCKETGEKKFIENKPWHRP